MLRPRRWVPALAAAALFAAAAAADAYLTERTGSVLPSRVRKERGALVGNLLGQFRTVAANWLWMKADVYHHEYIEKDPHWTRNLDILPLMRMVTWLDPHFTQAYASAAWMLALYNARPGQARAFLQEGLRYNPQSPDLHQTMAIIAWRCDGNPRAALYHLRKARDFTKDAFERRSLERSIASIEYQLAHGLKNPTLGSLSPERQLRRNRAGQRD